MRTPLRPLPARERKKQRDARRRRLERRGGSARRTTEEKEEEIKTARDAQNFCRPGRAIEIRDAAHVSKVRDKD